MLLLTLCALAISSSSASAAEADVQAFLDGYDSLYQRLYTLDANASWDAATDVSPLNEGRATAASQAGRPASEVMCADAGDAGVGIA